LQAHKDLKSTPRVLELLQESEQTGISQTDCTKSGVLLIGFDGADWSLIDGWEEDPPNLTRIRRTGARGILRSSVPSQTCPAWNCMMTGKKGEATEAIQPIHD